MSQQERPRASSRRLAGTVLALYLLQFLTLLMPLILLPVLTRRLGPEVWGVYAVQVSLGALVLLLLEFGFNIGATRRAAATRTDRAELGAIVSAVVGAKLLLAVAAAAVWLAVWFAAPIVREQAPTYWLMLVLTLVQGWSISWFFQAIGRLPFAFGWELATRAVATALIIVFVHDERQLPLVPAFQIAALVVTLIVTFVAARRHADLRIPHLAATLAMLRSNAHLALLRAVQSASSQGNTFLVGLLAPAGSAFYGASERASNAVRSLLQPVTQVAFPEFVATRAHDAALARKHARRALVLMTAGAVVVAAVLAALAEPVVLLLFGDRFTDAVPVLRVLFLTLPCFAVVQAAGAQWMLVLAHDRPFIVIVAGGLVLDVVSAVLVVPVAGVIGMAIGFLVAEVAVAAALVVWIEFIGPPEARLLRTARVAD